MKIKIHAIAGAVGFLTILVFWTSTLATELFASHAVIAAVKNNILWGMLLLIPAMALVGASGLSLGKGRTDTSILRKKKRMPFIALNGLLVLVRWITCGYNYALKLTKGSRLHAGYPPVTATLAPSTPATKQ